MKKAKSQCNHARQNCEKLSTEHKWIDKEKDFFGQRGTKFDFEKMDILKIREERKKHID